MIPTGSISCLAEVPLEESYPRIQRPCRQRKVGLFDAGERPAMMGGVYLVSIFDTPITTLQFSIGEVETSQLLSNLLTSSLQCNSPGQ